MNKKIVLMLMALCCLAGYVNAQSIVWVSDCYNESEPHDSEFINMLEDEGYVVTRMQDPQNLTQAKVDQMNAADLVVVGRHGNSGGYASNSSEIGLWNSVTTPMINQNPHVVRNNRWGWLNYHNVINLSDTMQAVVTEDPIFSYVELNEDDQVDIIDFNNNSYVDYTDSGNGTLVATTATNSLVWIVRWETGQEFYPGSGQYASAPRMYFPSAESGGTGDGTMNLNAQGQVMFMNAVYEMSGATFNRGPKVSAGKDDVVLVGVDVQLEGDVIDDGLPEPANISFAWTKLSGPGIVTFDDSSIINPVVSIDAAGEYVLELSVSDGDKVDSDTVTITVVDSSNNKQLALWSFDSMVSNPGTAVVDDYGSNDGIFTGLKDDLEIPSYIEEPNIITPGWVGNKALDMFGDSWVEITPEESDPNIFNLQTGVTVSAWIMYEGESFGGLSFIAGKGDNAWRLSADNVDGTGVHFRCNGTTARIDSTRTGLCDGYWHHVVGTYEAVSRKACLYIDGVLDTEMEAEGLIDVTNAPVTIGLNSEASSGRIWPGGIDDVRVYNYGISREELEALSAMAPVVPIVDAGEDVEYKRNAEGLTLAGTVIDDGKPVAASIAWSVLSMPEGAAAPEFSPADAALTVVEFSAPGTYTLQLTADDTIAAISDEVVITVVDPTCQDVIDAGLLLVGDVDQNCYIDLNDFAAIAANWLSCNDPQDANCMWPFN